MNETLPPHVWFVRSNGGSGSFPVRREGWRVVLTFVLGMFAWGIAAAALGLVGAFWGPLWISYAAPLVFAVGAALSAWYFIDTARRHTDYSITYNDYLKANKNA